MKKCFLALTAMFFLIAPFHVAFAQSDLVIATNAEITFPSCTDEMTYYYFFTVVDDDPLEGGTITTPDISGLDNYAFTGPNLIDVYESGTFNYATYELVVTITSPDLGATDSDVFTINYEGEEVNPAFDVTKADAEVCGGENEIVDACVNMENGMVRILQNDKGCRDSEYATALLLPPAPIPAEAAVAEPRR